jgi:hypothetical protein
MAGTVDALEDLLGRRLQAEERPISSGHLAYRERPRPAAAPASNFGDQTGSGHFCGSAASASKSPFLR